ncbi:MAG: 4-(cytidine 5'-diphospho)-2-C-methyl-D-erythritol kinase [Prevotellaceae bacterium]|nr:4-(cytidine 5'-diphospho)-2-C-methyl-D-erythritol kinase [Prevotellaceae bacterium]
MIVYPHAKINIGLQIVARRDDGYHDIETVIYPVDLRDILEIKPSLQTSLFLYGMPVDGQWQDNLCIKAYHLVQADFDLPPVQFHLYKQIPIGAGMGGGSSDGAYTLRLLNDYFSIGINELRLQEYATCLGSDCPAMLNKRPLLAKGRGEVLSNVHIDLSQYYMLICMPSLSISTAQAYAQAISKKPKLPLGQLLNLPVGEWRGQIVNDFESILFPKYPVLQEFKEKLYKFGALYASLSGSGSALYGIFESEEKREEARDYFTELQAFVW